MKCWKRPGCRNADRAGCSCKVLIHLAVRFYHYQRGNPAGAGRQLRKGLEKLANYLPFYEGIDIARLYREALAALEQIEAGATLPAYPQIHTSSGS